MPNKMSIKSHGSATLALSTPQEDIQSSEERIRTGFLQCSIEEEDCLDDIEPNLMSIPFTESFSSHVSSDIRSLGDCFEVTPDCHSENDIVNDDFCNQRLQGEDELKNYSEPPSARNWSSSIAVKAKPMLENLFDDALCTYGSKSKLSLSMHDVSKIQSFPLVSKRSTLSSETIQSQSITTVGSLPKSKDSGFPRSISCLSLNSGKSYDHIQSKVKEHIKQVKAVNKTKRKLNYETSTHEKAICVKPNCEDSMSPQILVPLINKLKEELEEKDRMLLKLQENYDALLMKYAAAENRIDHLRVNSVGNSFDITLTDYKKPKASPNVLLLPNLYDLQRSNSRLLDSQDKFKKINLSNQSNLTQNSTIKYPCASIHVSDSSEIKTQKSDLDYQLPLNYKPVPKAVKDKNLRQQNNCNINFEYNQGENEPSMLTDLNCLESPRKIETYKTRGIPHEENELSGEALNSQLENPFVKVKRWQESLPSLHLIEPSIYDQFSCNETESDALNQNHETRIDIPPYNLEANSLAVPVNEDSTLLKTPVHNRPTVRNYFSTPTNSIECEMAVHGNVSLLKPSQSHSVLNNSSNATATDLDAGMNLCKQSHNSNKSNTIATNLNSMSPSINSSSTYLCPEDLGDNLSIPPYVDENRCKESASISVQTDLNMPCDAVYTLTTFPIENSSNIPCVPKANDNQQCLYPATRFLFHKNCLLPPSYDEQPSVNITDMNVKKLQNTTMEIGTGSQLCHHVMQAQPTNVPVMDPKEEMELQTSSNLCKCNNEQNRKSVTCDCELACDLNNRKSYSDSFEEKNKSLIQYLDEMNRCAQKLRGKSEAIMQVLSAQLKES